MTPAELQKLSLCLRFLWERSNNRMMPGAGFSRVDMTIGGSLAEAEPKSWTNRQVQTAWRLAQKYDRQLKEAGLGAADVERPASVISAARSKVGVISLDDRGNVCAQFPYNEEAVNLARSIEKKDREYSTDSRTWKFRKTPAAAAVITRLMEDFGMQASAEAREWAESLVQPTVKAPEESTEASYSEDAELPEGLKLRGVLRAFQRAGVRYGLDRKRTIIGDQPGLGKTCQGIAIVEAARAYPLIVVCPAFLKMNWLCEIDKWVGRTTFMFEDSASAKELRRLHSIGVSPEIILINYDLIHKHMELLLSTQPRSVIFDESHYVKNLAAKRTKAAIQLAEPAEYRLLLTGTPGERPHDLVGQLEVMGRMNEFGGFWRYVNRFCQAKRTPFGWDFSGASNLQELGRLLRSKCMVRRRKQDVLKDLAPKVRAQLFVELENRAEYERAKKDIVKWCGEQAAMDAELVDRLRGMTQEQIREEMQRARRSAEKRTAMAEFLIRASTLKLLATKGKIESAVQWIEDFLQSGRKLVVFVERQETGRTLQQRLGCDWVYGGVDVKDRHVMTEKFQNDPECRVIIVSIQVAVGFNLYAASDELFVEMCWTAREHDQAEDRCHRIGQQGSVTCWYMMAKNTTDEDVFKLIEGNRSVASAALGDAPDETALVKYKSSVAGDLFRRMVSES